jgi:hypothetical protein
MIKKIKKRTTVEESHKYCDDCGIEIERGLRCNVAACEYCGKDLCDACIDHETSTFGDYRTVYCKKCWELGNDYRPRIEELSNEKDRLYEEWRSKCKE